MCVHRPLLTCVNALGVLSPQQIDGLVVTGSPRECLVDKGGVIAMRPLPVHRLVLGQPGGHRQLEKTR